MNPFIPVPISPSMMPEVTLDPSSFMPVPARVRIAIQFLQTLSFKTSQKVVINGMMEGGCSEQIQGQDLTTAERNVQATACHLINNYFLGKLKPDYWDKLYVKELTSQQDPMLVEQGPVEASSFMRCFACLDVPKRDCILCRGAGNILVTPVEGGGRK